MSSATERLRAMLDERGVEHNDFEIPYRSLTLFWDGKHDGAYTENSVDTILTVYGASPEEAVEATLGSGLKAENDKLREELAKWERLMAGINLPDYPVSQFLPKDLERENAKLRELLAELYESAWLEHPSAFEHTFADRMRELGIEVVE